MARVFSSIPCPHSNYFRNTLTTPQVKQLLVKFVIDSHNGNTFALNPWCSDCQDDMTVIATAQGWCQEFRNAVLEDVKEEVQHKITGIIMDDQDCYFEEFVYMLDGRSIDQEEEEVVTTMMDERAVFEESLAAFWTVSEEAIEALESVVATTSQVVDDGSKCAICLEQLIKNEEDEVVVYRKMPCKHEFHEGCIIEWLHTNHFCPLCRFELPIAI